MVSVFSRPQKMVFDCVYGRREGGCDRTVSICRRMKATARHYTTPFVHCYLSLWQRRFWAFALRALCRAWEALTLVNGTQAAFVVVDNSTYPGL